MDSSKWKLAEGSDKSLHREFCVSVSELSQSDIRLISLFNSVRPGLRGK